MSTYTLNFEAKFSDDDADLTVRIAALLSEARAEMQRAEIDTLRAELAATREPFLYQLGRVAELTEANSLHHQTIANLNNEIMRLREALQSAKAVVDRYCWDHPKWIYEGKEQDPWGSHAAAKLVSATLEPK